ncbi:hypothetical protein FDB24_00125 [Clostridium botulinum]|uniref:pyocin knob domain-containing protein n=1 Tax=Clostridium botulinum TaxID=1491 RepID=UPI000773C690|nr:pyocin knob domain-containing protein [Clostridium botulinum]NFL86222.1 hypothetical protein [Clostridium botulinum]NFO19703.1 hypothetical protein [Clostridium botulinum]
MTTYSPFELEPIFIDFKNESYNLGLDIQANQNDTLTLNFICRNNGIEEDMSKYKVELRVHNNNANVDYIQTQNENVTLGKDGLVKIVCQSLKGNKLTAYSGQLNGVLRIFNTENKQKATRIITMRIIADPLVTDRANICESTITKLEDLDWILNEAYNIEDEFKKAIKEAIKQKDALIKTTNEAKVINTTLAGNITTGTELNSNLVNSNKLAETNQKELDTRNTAANKNIETLTNKNTTANETIINISNKIEKGTKLDNDLEEKTIIGTTLKSDLDTNIKTGTQLKIDLTELIPQANKSKSDLDTSKINADLSNITLTETTNNAETKKQEVIEECKVADEKIKQMSEFGDVTEVVKDVTSLKTEITTARDNETDLNARLERDKTNILKTIGQVNVETDGDIASQLKEIEQNYYSLNNAIPIPSNSDLNNYTEPGNYFSAGSGISNTLTNCPFTDGAFALKVERITIGTAINLRQILKANSSNVITCERNCLNGTWLEKWKQLATVEDTGWIDLPLASGITVDGKITPQYRRVNNQVFICGSILGVDSTGKVVATLPVGFRPSRANYYVGFTTGTYTNAIRIDSNGNIIVQSNSSGTYDPTRFATLGTNFIT